MTVQDIRRKLQGLGNEQKAEVLQRFFKTGPGEYGEGDVFLGIRVPELRKLAKEHQYITTREIKQLLKSSIHEERTMLRYAIEKFPEPKRQRYLKGKA